jgi:hypothetical protein
MAEAATRLDDLADSLPTAAADVGGDTDVGVGAEPVEHPAETTEPPPTSSDDGVDPLDRLLRQWDEDQNGNNGAASSDDDIIAALDEANRDAAAQARNEQEFAAAQQRYAADSAQSAMALATRDQENAQLRGTVHQLQQTIWAEQQRQHRLQSKADFDALIAPIQKELEAEGLDIPSNHVETQLLAAAARDSALIEAFESKYFQGHDPLQAAQLEAAIRHQGETWAKAALSIANPVQRLAAQRHIEARLRTMWEAAFVDPAQHRAKGAAVVRRAIDQIVKDARRPRIDERISGDVLAVAAAVRGASGKPPPDPPVNLGRMTAGEFARHTMERYGF